MTTLALFGYNCCEPIILHTDYTLTQEIKKDNGFMHCIIINSMHYN